MLNKKLMIATSLLTLASTLSFADIGNDSDILGSVKMSGLQEILPQVCIPDDLKASLPTILDVLPTQDQGTSTSIYGWLKNPLQVGAAFVGQSLLTDYVEEKLGGGFQAFMAYQTGSEFLGKALRIMVKPELHSTASSISYTVGSEIWSGFEYTVDFAKSVYNNPKNYKTIFWDTTTGVARVAVNATATIMADRYAPDLIKNVALTATKVGVGFVAGPVAGYAAGYAVSVAINKYDLDKHAAAYLGAHAYPIAAYTLGSTYDAATYVGSYAYTGAKSVAETVYSGAQSAVTGAANFIKEKQVVETVSSYASSIKNTVLGWFS